MRTEYIATPQKLVIQEMPSTQPAAWSFCDFGNSSEGPESKTARASLRALLHNCRFPVGRLLYPSVRAGQIVMFTGGILLSSHCPRPEAGIVDSAPAERIYLVEEEDVLATLRPRLVAPLDEGEAQRAWMQNPDGKDFRYECVKNDHQKA